MPGTSGESADEQADFRRAGPCRLPYSLCLNRRLRGFLSGALKKTFLCGDDEVLVR